MRLAPSCSLSRWALYAVLLAAALVLGPGGTARADDDAYTADDTLAAIDQAAAASGVSWAHLYRVVACEDRTFDPYAIGDHGASYGPVQLNRYGDELPRFYAAGWTDPFDPYQSVQFLADELAAQRGGHWSCR